MSTVKVVAVIAQNGKVLATQRGYGDLLGGWEFPGGKMEEGETPEEAVRREIHEELFLKINVERRLAHLDFCSFDRSLSMECLLCSIANGKLPVLTEHRQARWVGADDIDTVDWLPADAEIAKIVKDAGILT